MIIFRLIKLCRILLDRSFFLALGKGTAAGTEHLPVLANFRFDTVVDIGANRGQFALTARKAYPRAQIHSFEPLAEPQAVFRRVFAGDPGVTLYPYAIGREKTSATLHVTREDDSSSLLAVTATQTGLFPGAAEVATRQVAVSPLSQALDPSVIQGQALLKIDVQGYELEVLQGCEDLLPCFSHLYIECSFIELYAGQALAHQVIAWLAVRGFDLTSLHNLYYGKNGLAVQGDFLFTRRECVS
jgi:FkbM family methyltransferase